MTYVFTIKGTLPGLNEYIDKNRRNVHAGNGLKQKYQRQICKALKAQAPKLKLKEPVQITYMFYEPNRRRDKDNISGFAHKVIQDAMVECHLLNNDGWANIDAFEDCFAIDRDNPRIVLFVKEAE